MKSELDHKIDLVSVVARQKACLDLMVRVRGAITDPQFAFSTGRIFGQYLQELKEEERKLNAEGEAYDKAQDAELEARGEDIPF